MGTFTLIPPMSLGNLNKAEKLSLLKRYMKLMPSGSDSESPDEISLLADSGVPVLNISAGQVTRMNGIIDELTELTMQASSSEETPEMQQVEADRDTAGNYIVRSITPSCPLPPSVPPPNGWNPPCAVTATSPTCPQRRRRR